MKKLFKFTTILVLGAVCSMAFAPSLEARCRSWFSFGIGFGGIAPAPIVQYCPAPVIVERYYQVPVVYEAPVAVPVPPPSNIAITPVCATNRIPLAYQNRPVLAPRTYVYQERVAPVNYTAFSVGYSKRR